MTDAEPDFPAEMFPQLATLPQRETLEKMIPFGWTLSHMWKRDEGDIVPWLICRTPSQNSYSHAYINQDGSVGRYEGRRVSIPGRGPVVHEY